MAILAGIVLYNPDLSRLNENISAIYKQVDKLVLVDNGSNNIKLIKKLCMKYSNILLIENNENKGISVALNQIMNTALKFDCEWALLLDQDSICPSGIISEYKKYIGFNNVAIICPNIVDRNSKAGDSRDNIKTGYEYIEKHIEECITSGSFVNHSIWREVGGFDEKMFIDYVDLEYCRRVQSDGYKILKLKNISLLHELGHMKIYKFLWIDVPTYDHSAFRKYYITRNTLYFTRKYRNDESIFIAYLKIIKRFLIVILYENDKKEKIKAMIRGFKDSFTMGL